MEIIKFNKSTQQQLNFERADRIICMPIVGHGHRAKEPTAKFYTYIFEVTKNGRTLRFRQSEHKLQEVFANQNVLKYKRPDNCRPIPE